MAFFSHFLLSSTMMPKDLLHSKQSKHRRKNWASKFRLQAGDSDASREVIRLLTLS